MMMYSKERYIVVVVVTFSIKLGKSCQARGEKLYKIVGRYEHYCGFVFPALFFFSTWIVIKPNRTPRGKKTVVRMQLVTASQVQNIRCR